MVQYRLVPPFSVLIAVCVLFGMGTSFPLDSGSDSRRAFQSDSTRVAFIELKLTATDSTGTIVATDKAIGFYLSDEATDEWDSYDASKIIPSLTDEFALLAFVGEKNGEKTLKAQESRPYLEDEVEVVDTRLIRTTNLPSDLTYSLSVTDWYQVPSDWSLKINTEQLDEALVFDGPTSSHTFSLTAESKSADGTGRKIAGDTTHSSMISEVQTASALPVELSNFSAQTDGDAVQVQWQTTSETNNAGFAVEHRSEEAASASAWSAVGFVDGAGTTSQPRSYRFRVDDLDYGTHTFRLRQVDTDGTVTTTRSASASLQLQKEHEISAPYPNPARDRATVKVTARRTQPVRVSLYDVRGRRVRTVYENTLSGQRTHRVEIKTEDLSSSAYFLQVEGAQFSETRRLTVVQ